MALKVAVQMDPVEGINIHTDTTFLMMETAQERGHSLWVYTPDRLGLQQSQSRYPHWIRRRARCDGN